MITCEIIMNGLYNFDDIYDNCEDDKEFEIVNNSNGDLETLLDNLQEYDIERGIF